MPRSLLAILLLFPRLFLQLLESRIGEQLISSGQAKIDFVSGLRSLLYLKLGIVRQFPFNRLCLICDKIMAL